MLKKALVAISVVAILMMVAVSYLTARFVDHKEILRAKTEAVELLKSRDSIMHAVAIRDTIEMTLGLLRDSLLTVTSGLRRRVDSIETTRVAAQLGVRMLRTGDLVEEKLRETFPAIKASMRVADIVDPETSEPISYFMVPLGFAETFVVEHQNAAAFREKGITFATMDSLSQQVIGFQDSIAKLERLNRVAIQQGYDSAVVVYGDLNRKYIGLLEKPPQVKIGLPHWGAILVSLAGGVVIGTQLK